MSLDLTESSSIVRPTLRLALPVLAEQFLAMLVGFSDTVLAGHYLEKPHLAAISLMAYVLWLMFSFSSVVAIGATALVARFTGAGRLGAARRATNQALLVALFLSVIATAAAMTWREEAIAAMQLEGEPAALAARFLQIVLLAMPMLMFGAVANACLRGAGDTVAGLVTMGIVNAVNVTVSWALVLGVGPLPALGWDGLAIGTALGYVVGGAMMFVILLRGRAGLKIGLRWLRPDWNLIGRMLRIGIPGGLDNLLIMACQFWFLSVIYRLGELASAAHGVAIRAESLGYLPGTAFQVAAATLAGQYLGARDYDRAGRSVWFACLTGGAVMASAGLVFFTAAESLTQLLIGTGQIEVAQHAAPLLRTISFAMPFLALSMILSGALRGAGDTRWPLLVSLVGLLGVRIPVAHWLALSHVELPILGLSLTGCGLGVLGAWYAMLLDLVVRAALVVWRFASGVWKHVEV